MKSSQFRQVFAVSLSAAGPLLVVLLQNCAWSKVLRNLRHALTKALAFLLRVDSTVEDTDVSCNKLSDLFIVVVASLILPRVVATFKFLDVTCTSSLSSMLSCSS